VLALGYYIRPIGRIWSAPRSPVRARVQSPKYLGPALALAAAANIVLGLVPALIARR